MVDAVDSKSTGSDTVPVRVRLRAPTLSLYVILDGRPGHLWYYMPTCAARVVVCNPTASGQSWIR